MKGLTGRQAEVMNILKRGGIHSAGEISKETGIDRNYVSNIVRVIREKYYDGNCPDAEYIYSSKLGYTIEESPEHVAYESSMRMKKGFGTLLGGRYVFQRHKELSPPEFKRLMGLYQPRIGKLKELGK